MPRPLFRITMLLFCLPAFAWCQQLLKDINSKPGTLVKDRSSYIQTCYKCGAFVYFIAEDIYGAELWRTDGTESGTIRLSDIGPGSENGVFPNDGLTCLNNKLFFRARTGALYTSNGSANGTVAVVGHSMTSAPKTFNQQLFYIDGRKAWLATPDLSGKTMFTDFNLIQGFSGIAEIAFTSNKIFFMVMVATTPESVTFEVWVSDGSSTTKFTGLPAEQTIFDLGKAGDKAIISTTDASFVQRLWATDGTPAGTEKLGEQQGINGDQGFRFMKEINGTQFVGSDSPRAFWATDGTIAGTVKVLDGMFALDVVKRGDNFYMVVAYQSGLYQLFKTSADFSSSQLITPLEQSIGTLMLGYGHGLALLGDKVLVPYANSQSGFEIGVVDNLDQVQLLKDINPGQLGSFYRPFEPLNNEQSVFVADDGVHGFELWKTDGTESGTTFVKDVVTGTGSSIIETFYSYNGKLYFVNKPENDLWVTDGTTSGTVVFKNKINATVLGVVKNNLIVNALDYKRINLDDGGSVTLTSNYGNGMSYSNPLPSTQVGDQLFFFAGIPVNGQPYQGNEIHRANIVSNDISLVKDINPGAGTSQPFGTDKAGQPFGNKLAFIPTMPTGPEVWISDGTESGTKQLKDTRPGGNDQASALTVVGNRIYFIAATPPNNSFRLWQSDGTEEGTNLVELPNVVVGTGGLAGLGNKLVFNGNSEGKTQPWIWDADTNTASLVKVINPVGISPTNFFSAGARVFFCFG